jgi:hypothetical protein
MSDDDEIKKKGRKERKSSSSVDKRNSVGKTKKASEKKPLGGRKTSDKKSSLPLNDEQEKSPGENQDDSLESPETNSLSRSSRDLESPERNPLGISPSTGRKKSSSPEEGTTSQDKEIPVLLEAREMMAFDESLEEDNSSEEDEIGNGQAQKARRIQGWT